MKYKITDTTLCKFISSETLNCIFNKKTGYTATWGKTKEDDPLWSPPGPFILDCEVSTVCHQGCSACYKSNTVDGKNMSLDTWKNILRKMPKTLQQCAFGIGSIDSCDSLWDIFNYTRSVGIVPNLTINGSRMKPEYFEKLASVLGACAVSLYNRDLCYSTVQKLCEAKKQPGATLRQINIHQVLHEESLSACFQTLIDILEARTDSSHPLHSLNAVVFLTLKPKGKRNKFTQLRDKKKYKELIDFALNNNLQIGFDSCGCNIFEETIRDRSDYKQIMQSAESCESTLFSSYINVDGDFFPCSFTEGTPDWETGISVIEATNFGEVWNHPRTTEFRQKLLSTTSNGCRNCPIYDLKFIKE